MRITLSIDDDVLDAARALAEAELVSLGEAISKLSRLGMARARLVIASDGMPLIQVPGEFPRVTQGEVARAFADFP